MMESREGRIERGKGWKPKMGEGKGRRERGGGRGRKEGVGGGIRRGNDGE